jgi:predicted permease
MRPERWFKKLSFWMRSLLHRRELDQELDDEIAYHIEAKTEENLAKGMTPEEARRAARIELGGVEQVKEQVRAERTGVWLDSFLQDIRFGLRMLCKNPGFTAVAVLTLALGIGANTAVFSVVNGVLLKPLPYAQPDRLVAVYAKNKAFDHSSISYPNFLDWVRDQHSFSGLAAYRGDDYNLTGMGEPQRVSAEMVSANFFPILGINPVIGRQFRPEEDQIGAQPVALISGGFWEREFGSSRDAVGKTLDLNGIGYTIVGVIPASFQYQSFNFQDNTDVFVPIGQWSNAIFRRRDANMGMDAIGRLKPGITLAQAKDDMDAIAARLAEAYPGADRDSGIALYSLQQDLVGHIRPFLLVLLAAVAFVLLIACVNVANLLLARSRARTREFAIRAALGASQRRVIRELLTESLVLALAGGACGLVLALWGTQAALGVLPQALPRAQSVHVDVRVLLFTFVASVMAGVLFGLAPAIKTARGNLHETMKESGRGASGARHRLQGAFVIAEMALALVLLIGAGLMIRSLANLWDVNPGFNPRNLVTFGFSYPKTFGGTPDAVRASMLQVESAVENAPGVVSASVLASAAPMMGDSELTLWLDNEPKPATMSQMKPSLFYPVQPDYLKTMGIALIRGRFINAQDNERAPFVIVIDQDFAKQYFPGQDPIGRRVNFVFMKNPGLIVGIVGHVKQWGLDEGAKPLVGPQLYFPISQVPFFTLIAHGGQFVVRTQGPPDAEVKTIRAALGAVNGGIVVYEVHTMNSVVSGSLAARRFSMILLGIFAALALVLSCIGIYGVISYLVGQRTHEIGIRMALGALRTDILREVLGWGSRLALIGVSLGVVVALGLTRFLTTMLFGVSATDPLAFAVVVVLLLSVALLACWIPARRAMRVDPMVALRYE